MTHTETGVIQSNEYYPFGLQTAGSWTRDNSSNNFLYNGGTEANAVTALYDLLYRNYDPALGRFHQVDPIAGKFGSLTPYNFAFNDPVFWNDPNGDNPTIEELLAWLQNLFKQADSNSGGSGSGWSFPTGWDILKGDKAKDKLAEYINNVATIGPGSVENHKNGDTVDNLFGSWVFQNGDWQDISTSTQLKNRIDSWKSNVDQAIEGASDLLWKFAVGFYDGPQSNLISLSSASGGWGVVFSAAEAGSEVQGQFGVSRAIRLEGRQAAKFLGKVAGPSLGAIGVLSSTIESATDNNGYTWGDGAKTFIGVGLVGLAFTFAAPVVAVYAISDIGVGLITGTSITDRIGNGIDNVMHP